MGTDLAVIEMDMDMAMAMVMVMVASMEVATISKKRKGFYL
jgi:hypothetical protein